MRLFVALNLPDQRKKQVHAAAAPLRDMGLPVRWVPPEDLHVTLKFLGEVDPDHVSRLENALKQVGGSNSAFEAQVANFGAFPTIRRPRVIWAGVDPSPAVRCLKQDLEWALSDCGFERETRAFHPHVTLGRAEKEGGAGAFRGLDEKVADMEFSTSFAVRSLVLMRSHLSRTGSRYSVVSSSTLGGAS